MFKRFIYWLKRIKKNDKSNPCYHFCPLCEWYEECCYDTENCLVPYSGEELKEHYDEYHYPRF